MRKLVYYIAASLDGRIAGPKGEFDFFPTGDAQQSAAYAGWVNSRLPETVPTAMREPAGVADVPPARFDTVLMGHGTYRDALALGAPSPYAHLRQYVVSRTLGAAPDPAVTVVDGDPVGFVRALKRERGRDLWLCGGGKLAGALLPEIDELILKSYPVVAGAGVALFDGGFDPTPFLAADREVFPNGVSVTWYTARR
ncbi:dihydrofolate reductase family protein [Streptomyces uncialis]|uniref:dihydrofolate reductase family protein n=1 Tax=Streptomyces uncialis TaxID=1048205 RepID=UPI00225534E4|nr:dihydrofolate reductase family protein [Streptomyces uncialis]MCX4662136.1 dihydrofolate reductase family protein [Streptomyces uncialis]